LIGDLSRSQAPLLLALVNYAETLVRPARDEKTLRVAIRAIETMGISLVAPTPAIARDAARLRGLQISLADGFALATARAHKAEVATFDERVQRSLPFAGLALTAAAS
jgi:predicted nucleic acid-binding protein